MITIAVETLGTCLEELKAHHLQLHYEELALNKDAVPLDPQYELYWERERKGELLMVIGRDAGRICAYWIGFVCPGLHYRTCLTATMDIYFVAHSHRGKSGLANALKLFRFTEKELRRRGVQRWFNGSKLHRDSGKLFEFLEMTATETYYSKWLGE